MRIVIEGDVINNLYEAYVWLKEAWAYKPYNIYYKKCDDKYHKYYIEFIDIEPVKGFENYPYYCISSMEEFEEFIKTH